MKRYLAIIVMALAMVIMLPAAAGAAKGPPTYPVGYPGGTCDVFTTFGYNSAPLQVTAPGPFCTRFGW